MLDNVEITKNDIQVSKAFYREQILKNEEDEIEEEESYNFMTRSAI